MEELITDKQNGATQNDAPDWKIRKCFDLY